MRNGPRARRTAPACAASILVAGLLGLSACRHAAPDAAAGAGPTASAGGAVPAPSVAHAVPDPPAAACRNLADTACQAAARCRSLNGTNAAGKSEYAGCATAVGDAGPLLCADGFTCGRSPGAPARCLQFSSLCLPDGWKPLPACDAPGCPKPLP